MRTYLVTLAFIAALFVALRAGSSGADTPPVTTTTEAAPPVDRTLQGMNVEQWHDVATRYLARVRSLHRTIRYDPETSSAIRLACIVYPGAGCDWLWRVARCESNLHRYSVNLYSRASGLFQFLPSTWSHTPMRTLDVFDPYANALAAAWLAARGGRGQWVCQ
jgi:muramidase (phage lysozyme)